MENCKNLLFIHPQTCQQIVWVGKLDKNNKQIHLSQHKVGIAAGLCCFCNAIVTAAQRESNTKQIPLQRKRRGKWKHKHLLQ